MAAPSVSVSPPEAYDAGCRASSTIGSSTHGTGVSLESYIISASAANGWQFTHFTCHLTQSTTSPDPDPPQWVNYNADFSTTTNPASDAYNEQYGSRSIQSGYIDYDILEIGTGRDEWTATNLVAHFQQTAPTTYLVTLDPRDGAGGTATVNATYGAAMPSAVMPTRTGYTFNGYFTGKNGSGTKYYNADGTSARNWDRTSATTLYASWTANHYTIRIYADPQGGGQVSFDNITYQDVVSQSVSTPTTFTLYARPTSGWTFKRFEVPNTWSSTDNPLTYTISEGYVDIRAVFEQIPVSYYTVTTAAKYAAGGSVTGGGTYAAGTTITLTATPNQGYKFSGWKSSAGDMESSPSFSYTVNSDVTWTAFFGTWRLIYFDRAGSGIDIPGDAIVTIDFTMETPEEDAESLVRHRNRAGLTSEEKDGTLLSRKSFEEVGKALREEQTVNNPTERNTRLRPRGLGRQAPSTRQSSGEQSTRQASASSARKQLTPKSGNSLTVSPSWAPSTSLSAQGTVALPKTTLDSVNNLTMGLTGSAGMSAVVVIQQRNVASFAYQNSLQQGVSVTMNINVSDGRITGVA